VLSQRLLGIAHVQQRGGLAEGGVTSGQCLGDRLVQWTITHRGDGRYSIANRTTGLVLDGGGNVASGSVTKQWTYGSSTKLPWTFTAL
jgi:alpha-L-fucosidase